MFFFSQTVCPHYGVLTVKKRSSVHRAVHFRTRLSSAQARTEFRFRRQYRTAHGLVGAGFWIVLPGVRARFKQNVV